MCGKSSSNSSKINWKKNKTTANLTTIYLHTTQMRTGVICLFFSVFVCLVMFSFIFIFQYFVTFIHIQRKSEREKERAREREREINTQTTTHQNIGWHLHWLGTRRPIWRTGPWLQQLSAPIPIDHRKKERKERKK